MEYGKWTISQFRKAWFEKDYSEMPENIFTIVYSEYISTAGLYESEDYEKVVYITFLNNRVNSIKFFLKLQRDFLEEFSVPCEQYFYFVKDNFGYILKWEDDKQKFLHSLVVIEEREKLYISKLEMEIQLLKEFRENKKKQQNYVSPVPPEEGFIRTLNSLGKIGYNLDEDKTKVQTLAIMIKQQKEEVADILNRR